MDEAGSNTSRRASPVSADNPIRSADDDTLERIPLAQSFATQILSLDASEGIVVGVLGPWGSGKTSFVNLSRSFLEERRAPVLDFNPWLFSGTAQLLDAFFNELSAQLKLRRDLAEVGKTIEEYGELLSGLVWLPVVGRWIHGASMVGKIFQRRRGGVKSRRSKVEEALKALTKPVIVVVDDIDRLDTPEIRDIFKLVRLTASFPNVVYLLAFDRSRVESALSEQGIPGRDYLEKILQVSFDMPAIPVDVLTTQLTEAINRALSDIENAGRRHEDRWHDIFMEVIRPLVRNMRDVRRYAAGACGSVQAFDGSVAVADVLALEAIRMFLPEVSQLFPRAAKALTTTAPGDEIDLERQFSDTESQVFEQEIGGLLEAANPRAEIVRCLIKLLFPAAYRHVGGHHFGIDRRGEWLRDKRVAHEDIFRLYRERVVGTNLQNFPSAEEAENGRRPCF